MPMANFLPGKGTGYKMECAGVASGKANHGASAAREESDADFGEIGERAGDETGAFFMWSWNSFGAFSKLPKMQ